MRFGNIEIQISFFYLCLIDFDDFQPLYNKRLEVALDTNKGTKL